MKNWNFWHYLLLIIGIFIIIYIVSPSARKWWCNTWNGWKDVGAKCSNCETNVSGVIASKGQCLPVSQVAYNKCSAENGKLENGSDCTGCGQNPEDKTDEAFSGKGVTINGKCVALPDAFAGKICVPENAAVTANPISYKRESIGEGAYKYFRTDGANVSQKETLRDTEISKSDYVSAFVQSVSECPAGQIKV